jgi:uncharacterized protein (DUF1499 family)
MRAPPPVPVSRLATWCQRFGLLAALIGLISVAGAQLERLSSAEVLALLGTSFTLSIVALVLGASALVIIWCEGFRGLARALFGMAIASAILAYPAYGLARSIGLPPINDITTDVETPPAFELTAGKAEVYPRPFAVEQRAAYPALQPVTIDVEPLEAQRLVADSLTNLGIGIVDEKTPSGASDEGRILAVQESRIFRFVDDIVIRVRPLSATETRIDIRSRSRIGKHDLGTNARRVQAIIEELTRLAADQD